MGFIEVWFKAIVTEHVAVFLATVLLSLFFTYAVVKGEAQGVVKNGTKGIQEKDRKLIRDESVLVGASEEALWPWFAELKAKFRYMGEGHHLMFEAFKQNSTRILRAPLADYEFYILPPHYMEELKSLPTTVMSSSVAVQEYLLGELTTMKAHTMMGNVTWSVIRNHLTQKLGLLVEPLTESCQVAIKDELPNCPEWTPIFVHDTFLQIVGQITGRIFVGEELCKNKLLRHSFCDFATCTFIVSGLLKLLPSFLRPIAAIFMPQFWKIRLHRYNVRKILKPEIRKRLQEPVKQAEERKHAGKQDMIDWLIEASAPNYDEQNIIDRQIGINFAALHTTTNNVTNILYDLAARWEEYAPELIAEYKQALAEDGGLLQKGTVAKLSKLDSFMKESQRINPPSSLAFNRKVLQDHRLSDGKVLPKSCWIAVASGPLLRTESQFENPLAFDGFRYHRMRENESSEQQKAVEKISHFSSTGVYSLVFGHGRYACPGRFFAGLETKLILINILENYELRLPPGESRYENIVYADALVPDPSKAVLFKRLVK